MGLLSKAAAGSSNQFEEPVTRGGLLSIITRMHNEPENEFMPPITAEEPPNPFARQEEKAVRVSPLEKAVMEKLSVGYTRFGTAQGLVIEALKYSAGEFTGRLASMVSGFGTAQGLAPGRCLVLFDAAQDGELIGKHLAKTVPGNNIFWFRAENPQKAFSLLKPYL